MCHSSCARLLTSTSTTRTAGSCRCASSHAASTRTLPTGSLLVFIVGSSAIELGDRGARGGVDGQAEDVGTVVVADRVELLAGQPGARGVDLGVEDAGLADQRAGHDVAVRADDGAVAAGQPVILPAVQHGPAGQVAGQVGGTDAG